MSNISVGAARQLPGTRLEVSDRGFTGHRHNDSLGLIYMNARFYAPEGRIRWKARETESNGLVWKFQLLLVDYLSSSAIKD
jgi:hypothetical protein